MEARQVEHWLHETERRHVYLISFCLEILGGLFQLVFLLLDRQNLSMHNNSITEKKRKDYAFWRQLDEKPNIIPGWAGFH